MFKLYIIPGSDDEAYFNMCCRRRMRGIYTIEHHAFRVRGDESVHKIDIYDIGLLDRIRLRKQWNVLKGA